MAPLERVIFSTLSDYLVRSFVVCLVVVVLYCLLTGSTNSLARSLVSSQTERAKFTDYELGQCVCAMAMAIHLAFTLLYANLYIHDDEQRQRGGEKLFIKFRLLGEGVEKLLKSRANSPT